MNVLKWFWVLPFAFPYNAISTPLTLKQAFELAIHQNESLLASKLKVDQAAEHRTQTRALFIPKVSSYNAFDAQSVSLTSRLRAQANLFNGLKDYAEHTTSELLEQQNQSADNESKRGFYLQLTQVFYNELSAEADLKLLEDQLKVGQVRSKELMIRVRNGRNRESEWLVNESQNASLIAQIAASTILRDQAKIQFWSFTGCDRGFIPFQEGIEKQIPKLQNLEAYKAKLLERPDVQISRLDVDLAEQKKKMAWGGHLPSFDVVADAYLVKPSSLLSPWSLGVSLSIPIWEGLETHSAIKEASLLIQEKELRLAYAQRLALREVETAYETIQGLIDQLHSLEAAVKIAEKAYLRQTLDFPLGLATHLDVLQAFNTLLDYKRSLVRTHFSIWTQFENLHGAAGLNSRES